MTNILSISLILVALSIIVAFIGLFFVFKIWLVWKRLDKNLLKTMVFLDENFLMRNWVYLLATGAFIALRRVIEFLEILGVLIKSETETIIFDLIGLAVITLLVQLGYYWYRLIYSSLPPSK